MRVLAAARASAKTRIDVTNIHKHLGARGQVTSGHRWFYVSFSRMQLEERHQNFVLIAFSGAHVGARLPLRTRVRGSFQATGEPDAEA